MFLEDDLHSILLTSKVHATGLVMRMYKHHICKFEEKTDIFDVIYAFYHILNIKRMNNMVLSYY